jgi:uncharacterized C2H2 Zn-finger protein
MTEIEEIKVRKRDDQQLKQVTRCNLVYGKTKNPKKNCGFFG